MTEQTNPYPTAPPPAPYPPVQAQPYAPAVGYYPVVVQPRLRTDGLAIASMILGILWLWWVGSVLAVIFGHVALHRIKTGERDAGKGMAVAGLVLGYIGFATGLIFIIALAVGASSPPPGG